MNKLVKLLLGFLTLLPILYMIGFTIFTALAVARHEVAGVSDYFWILFIVHGLMMFTLMTQIVLYVVHLFQKNTKIADTNTRIMWGFMLFFCNMAAIPVYWWLYIWPDDTPHHTLQKPYWDEHRAPEP